MAEKAAMERAAAAARAPRGGGVLDKLLRLLGIDAAAHDNKSAKRHAKSKPSPSPRSPPSSSLFFAPNKLEDQLRISWSDIELGPEIGHGGFGVVHKGKWHSTRVAVKLLHAKHVSAELLTHLREEALMMAELRHPSIARVYGLTSSKGRVGIVMHYYRHGTVEEFMNGTGRQHAPAGGAPALSRACSGGSTSSSGSGSYLIGASDSYTQHVVKHFPDPYAVAGRGRLFCGGKELRPSGGAASPAGGSSFGASGQGEVRRYEDLHLVTRLRMALQVAKGLMFLHTRQPTPIVHGDLKTSNLLMDGQCRVVLADFGLARQLHRHARDRYGYGLGDEDDGEEEAEEGSVGAALQAGRRRLAALLGVGREAQERKSALTGAMTAHIVPPEVIADPTAPREPPADVFAFAIVLLEMVLGRDAYDDHYPPKLILRHVLAGRRPELPHDPYVMPPAVASLIRCCWAQEPRARPSSVQVVARLERVLDSLVAAHKEFADADATRWL